MLEQIQITTENEFKIDSISEITEKSRGRLETRKASVSTDIAGISQEWIGLKSIIKVERKVVEKKETRYETAYYISSLEADAYGFNLGIRGHWAIENSLHYVKDVTFKEDNSKIKAGNSAENFSTIRNIVINIFRNQGEKSMISAIRLISNDIKKLKKKLE